MRTTRTLIKTAFFAASILVVCAAHAAEQANPSSAELSIGWVQDQLDRIQANGSLDAAPQQKLLDVYGQTLSLLKSESDWIATQEALRERIASQPAPGAVGAGKQMVAAAQEALESGADLTQLEQLRIALEKELAGARGRLIKLQSELSSRPRQRQATSALLRTIRVQSSRSAVEQQPISELEFEHPDLMFAMQALEQAQERALAAQMTALEFELASYEERGRSLRQALDAAGREVSQLSETLESVRAAIVEGRLESTRVAMDRARTLLDEIESSSPETLQLARSLYEQIVSYGAIRAGERGVIREISRIDRANEAIREMIERVSAEFESVSGKVEAAGSGVTIGALLKRFQAALPDRQRVTQDIDAYQALADSAQFTLIELNDAWLEFAEGETALEDLIANTTLPSAEISDRLISLVTIKRDLVEDLVNEYNQYFDSLMTLLTSEQDLLRLTEQAYGFIDERVLWVRNAAGYRWKDFAASGSAIRWLFGRENWRETASATGGYVSLHYLSVGANLLLWLVLVALQPRLRRRLAQLAKMARGTVPNFRVTAEALGHTILISAPAPIAMAYFGYILAASYGATDFGRAVGAGLQGGSIVLFALLSFFAATRPDGVTQAHLNWPSGSVDNMRRHLRWFGTVLWTLVVIVLTLYRAQTHSDSLGRTCFALGCLVFAAFAHMMSKRGGPIETIVMLRLQKRAPSLKRIWHVFAVGTPLILLFTALNGYSFASFKLSVNLLLSIWVVFLMLLTKDVLTRGVAIARRKAAVSAAKMVREAEREGEDLEGIATEDTQMIDLARLDAQTRKLINAVLLMLFIGSLYWIWSHELPAFRFLDAIPVGQLTPAINLGEGEASKMTPSQIREMALAITWGDLLVAFVMAAIAIVLTKNLPALLEITLMNRFQMGSGERYAVKTVTRYIIIGVGILAVAQQLGLEWSKLQWLVAALGLGLGFGLQEIFANFISGLIILFERPIRVGDTVTVAGTSGVVSRIRTRATWVTDFDRKELIVPNKQFVTSPVVNWTSSDPMLRLVFPVAVAYGSDTRLAEQTLLEVAKAHALVAKSPEPYVVFRGPGPASLNFELRVYCESLESYLTLLRELYANIEAALRDRGLEPVPPQAVSVNTDLPVALWEARQVRGDQRGSPR